MHGTRFQRVNFAVPLVSVTVTRPDDEDDTTNHQSVAVDPVEIDFRELQFFRARDDDRPVDRCSPKPPVRACRL
ncbi:unnamed protein product [Soboliphyme baturini]|uniref:Kinesin motor domain-containing protein n=1 Tax=Soboliphyme baturini TaxID=241478 RepID=A0A183IL65_9BILA|nr:unnamed protein product [Soboliphyme baturini]